jgi:hypothetical protein
MTACKNRKRVQLYLDGWMDESEAVRFEAHLRSCPDCQAELINLEEVSSSALEIVDQAPDAGYWNGFFNRVLNRIVARNVSPYETRKVTSRRLKLRIGSYAVAITTVAAVLLLTFTYALRSPHGTDSPAVSDKPTAVADTPVEEVPIVDADTDRSMEFVEMDLRPRSSGDQSTSVPANQDGGSASEGLAATSGATKPAGSDEDEPAIRADAGFRDLFSDAIRQSPAHLNLDGDSGFLDRLMSLYGGRGSDDYRLDQETVVEAVLSGYGPWIDAGGGERSPGISLNGSIPGVAGRPYPELPEMSEKEELARYMIELRIMRAK